MRCKLCNTKLGAYHPSVAKIHLKTHKAEWVEFEKSQTETPKTPSKKRKFGEFKENELNEVIARILAKPSSNLLMFKDTDLRSLIPEEIKLPESEYKSKKLLRNEACKMVERIKQMLTKNIGKTAAVFDVWTQPGMKNSYIGGTIQWITENFELMHAFIGLSELTEAHTASIIKEHASSLLSKVGLTLKSVSSYVTDSGSNMKAAFREDVNEIHTVQEQEKEDYEQDDDDETENDQDFEYEEIEDVENAIPDLEREMDEAEKIETEITEEFPDRLSCVAHIMTLCLRFVFDKELAANKVIKHCQKICSLFRRSHVAIKLLLGRTLQATGQKKTVLLPSFIRWGTTYIMVERVCEIASYMNEIASAKEWPTFTNHQLRRLKSIKELLQPFYEFLVRSQYENRITISKILFQVKELIIRTRECQVHSDIESMKSQLVKQLEKRFAFLWNESDANYNPTYVYAALLDPQECLLVDDSVFLVEDLLKKLASMQQHSTPEASESTEETNPNSSIRERLLAERRRRLSDQSSQKQINTTEVVQQYLQLCINQDLNQMDPLKFWNRYQDLLKPLDVAAMNYLAIPGTSASIERAFSTAGLQTKGVKNRTEAPLLNDKLLIHLNRHLL